MQLLDERHRITPNWRRLDAGGTRLTVIGDGIATFADLPALVGVDASADEIQRITAIAFIDPGRMPLSLNILFAESDGELVVFDTGIGALGRGVGCGLLASSLDEAGIDPVDVAIVCLTHLHADHIAGLMEDGAPLFPNARYVVGRREYDYWTSPAALADPRPDTVELVRTYVTPLRSRLTLVDDAEPVTPAIVARAAFGHSAGHMMFEVQAGTGPMLVVGDVLLHEVFAFQRPEWRLAFDADQRMAAQTRMRVLGELATRRIPLFGFHLPLPGIGYAERRDRGFAFVPATYQFA